MDRLISRCEVRQCFQMQPGVRVKENRRSHCYLVFTFSYYSFPSYSSHQLLCVLLAVEIGCLWVPVKHEDTRKYLNLGNQRRWNSDLYSIQVNAKFVFPMYKHAEMPPFCYGTVYSISTPSLAKPAAFFRTAEHFLRRTYAAPCR